MKTLSRSVKGILKCDFKINQVFQSRSEALLAVAKSIDSYNHLRPHMSCTLLQQQYVLLTRS